MKEPGAAGTLRRHVRLAGHGGSGAGRERQHEEGSGKVSGESMGHPGARYGGAGHKEARGTEVGTRVSHGGAHLVHGGHAGKPSSTWRASVWARWAPN